MPENLENAKNPQSRVSTINLGSHRVDYYVPQKVAGNTPILVMHDGGNLLVPRDQTWNGQNWHVVDSLEAGLVAAELQPVVVGVFTGDGTSRYNELAPRNIVDAFDDAFAMIPAGVELESKVSLANEYQDFLAFTVVPEIAQRLGINLDPSRTAIGGSSMGGLASIFGMSRNPEVFGTALALSTHWPFGWSKGVELLIDGLPSAGSNHRLWLDAGNTELDAAYPPYHYEAVDRLESRGWLRDRDFEARIYAGTGHQEKYWAARWPDAVNWWLSPSSR
jgi:predicted alpha/beta superfamily hydrolase